MDLKPKDDGEKFKVRLNRDDNLGVTERWVSVAAAFPTERVIAELQLDHDQVVGMNRAGLKISNVFDKTPEQDRRSDSTVPLSRTDVGYLGTALHLITEHPAVLARDYPTQPGIAAKFRVAAKDIVPGMVAAIKEAGVEIPPLITNVGNISMGSSIVDPRTPDRIETGFVVPKGPSAGAIIPR